MTAAVQHKFVSQNGQAEYPSVEAAGGIPFALVQNFFTPADGDTVFLLSNIPVGSQVLMYVNGVLYQQTVDYTVVGQTLTWLNTPFSLGPPDVVIAAYERT